jgi:hypothetical protein
MMMRRIGLSFLLLERALLCKLRLRRSLLLLLLLLLLLGLRSRTGTGHIQSFQDRHRRHARIELG